MYCYDACDPRNFGKSLIYITERNVYGRDATALILYELFATGINRRYEVGAISLEIRYFYATRVAAPGPGGPAIASLPVTFNWSSLTGRAVEFSVSTEVYEEYGGRKKRRWYLFL